MFCGSSSRCRRLDCCVWLWYFLIIPAYFLVFNAISNRLVFNATFALFIASILFTLDFTSNTYLVILKPALGLNSRCDIDYQTCLECHSCLQMPSLELNSIPQTPYSKSSTQLNWSCNLHNGAISDTKHMSGRSTIFTRRYLAPELRILVPTNMR